MSQTDYTTTMSTSSEDTKSIRTKAKKQVKF